MWFPHGIVGVTKPAPSGGAGIALEASGRVQFVDNNGTGSAGSSTDFDITVPGGLSDSAIVFMVDWWTGVTVTMSSVTVDTGSVVEIGTGIGCTDARDGGFAGRIMNPSSGTRTITCNWSASFGDGAADFKSLPFVVLSGVDQTTPVNVISDWVARASTSGNIADSVTTTEDGCFIMRSCHDWENASNNLSTMSGYTRIADAFDYSSAFYLEDAGTAGLKSSTYDPNGATSRITDFTVAIAPA